MHFHIMEDSWIGQTGYIPFLVAATEEQNDHAPAKRMKSIRSHVYTGLCFFFAFLILLSVFLYGGVSPNRLTGSLLNAEAEVTKELDIAFWSEADLIREFDAFARTYGKTYEDHSEKMRRMGIFRKHLMYIHVHNQQKDNSFTLAMNIFGDMTAEEFKASYASLHPVTNSTRDVDWSLLEVPAAHLPTSVDWRKQGCVSEVKDQSTCGSCWAFSTTGAVEGATCVATGVLTDLSEQQLVDCAGPEGNMACNGGEADWGFQYVMDNGGLCSEEDYPYKAHPHHCKARQCTNKAKIRSFKDVPAYSSHALRAAIAKRGPVSVAIEADRPAFQFYKSGVFNAHCGSQLDHAVLLVGYGSENDDDYFILKNSWGTSWGDSGYMKISAHGHHYHKNPDKGECGLFMSPSYAST